MVCPDTTKLNGTSTFMSPGLVWPIDADAIASRATQRAIQRVFIELPPSKLELNLAWVLRRRFVAQGTVELGKRLEPRCVYFAPAASSTGRPSFSHPNSEGRDVFVTRFAGSLV